MAVRLNKSAYEHAKTLVLQGKYVFKNVHRCGLLSAESRAAQYKHYDIASAVAHLHGMIEAEKHATGARAHTR